MGPPSGNGAECCATAAVRREPFHRLVATDSTDVTDALGAMGGWSGVLRPLLAGQDLTAAHARAALAEVLDGATTSAQLAAFLVALRMKGETVEEMSGLVEAMREAAERVDLPAGLVAVDTCGTGGGASRRLGAFNVSTIASFVIAGAGVAVCKHGNRAASSTSGSADLLEAMGATIDLGPTGVARCVSEAGMGFCFAPRFHPAMRHAGPTRREIGVPTVFNFLGPLANPAGVRRQVVGVSDPAMAERLVGVLQATGTERALVVFGHDGLDELTTTTTSTVMELHEGAVRVSEVDPVALGIPLAEPEAIRGGDVRANLDLARQVLDGKSGPHRDLVLLNAAAGLVVGGLADDLAGGYEAAVASIDDGSAARVAEQVVVVSRQAATG